MRHCRSWGKLRRTWTRESLRGQVGIHSVVTREQILVAPNSSLGGEVEGARLLHMAPTLLELGGYEIPPSMQGTSLTADTGYSAAEEELIRQRLSGLGYIS
jgi:hypothetical protein